MQQNNWSRTAGSRLSRDTPPGDNQQPPQTNTIVAGTTPSTTLTSTSTSSATLRTTSTSSATSRTTSTTSASNLRFNIDTEDDEMNNGLMPGPFHGLSTEDAEQWLKDIEHWCAYRKLDDAGSIGVIPLLMKDGARHWFETLPGNRKDTLRHFSDAFTDRYHRSTSNIWKDTATVWTTTQQPGQSVEAFISDMEQKGARAKMEGDQILFSIIKGLREKIRSQILQHEPKCIDDLRKWAIIAETSCDNTEMNNPELSTMIKRLEEKVDKMQMRQITRTRSQSPSPRVRFEEPGRAGYNGAMEGNLRKGGDTYSRPYANSYPRQNNSRDNPVTYRQPNNPSQNFQGRNRDQQSFAGRRPENATNNQGRQSCFNCGGPEHDFNICPARTIVCYNCSRRGHYSRFCRRARRDQH